MNCCSGSRRAGTRKKAHPHPAGAGCDLIHPADSWFDVGSGDRVKRRSQAPNAFGVETPVDVIERVFTASGTIRSSLFCSISTDNYFNLYPTLRSPISICDLASARHGDLAISSAFDYAMSPSSAFRLPDLPGTVRRWTSTCTGAKQKAATQ
jgi:hypothetical protein